MIAEVAGVSHMAVSKALNNADDISPATKERIRRIAESMGYTPNAAARRLVSQKANMIGMIVPAMGNNTSYSAVFNEISATAAERGYCVMLGSSHRSTALEEKHCRMMCENRVGALIIASCTSDVSHIKEICRNLVPIIFIGGKTSPEEPNALFCNYRKSAHLVVEHLTGLGHQEIAFFAYGPENLTIQQKTDGFIQSMTNYGLPPIVYKEGDAEHTLEAGFALTQRLISNRTLPTAIWCASDLMAIGVLNALREHGISVPEEISVIGHDDLYFDIFPDIALTTLHTPMTELGREAVKLACILMGEEVETTAITEFNTSLVVRGTTGPVKK
jgi:DNA-binding LacI/PurR family transcriptional regulator